MPEISTMPERIYCMERPDNTALIADLINARSNNDGAYWASMNNGMNNPMWFLWALLFRNGGLGYGDNCGGNAALSERLSSIERQAQDNHNNGLLMGSLRDDKEQMRELAHTLNISVQNLQQAIGGVQNELTAIGGKIGITGERVLNGIVTGNKDILATLQSCCCATQKDIMAQGYESRLQNEHQTNVLTSRIDQLANGITQGFSATAYESQRHTADIIAAGNANTQRILDTLNVHWQTATERELSETKLKLSQAEQTQQIVAAMNARGCNC